jgi:AcrR family transcriptional regulator
MGGKQQTAKTAYHHGELRGALLIAAEEELAEKGVEGFTLRGCAKRAGVSHAAPAHHFKDAGALLTALAAVGFERLTASMRARQGRASVDAHERLLASGLGYIDFAEANPALFKLMFGSDRPAAADEDLITRGSAAFMTLVEGIAAIRGDDPLSSPAGLTDIAAAWSLVHGFSHLSIAGKMPFLGSLLKKDRDAVLARIIARVAPKP